MAIYEACVGNYIEAKKAEELGANRIELCDNLLEGGTTPSYGTIKRVVEKINIPIMVIVKMCIRDRIYAQAIYNLAK